MNAIRDSGGPINAVKKEQVYWQTKRITHSFVRAIVGFIYLLPTNGNQKEQGAKPEPRINAHAVQTKKHMGRSFVGMEMQTDL